MFKSVITVVWDAKTHFLLVPLRQFATAADLLHLTLACEQMRMLLQSEMAAVKLGGLVEAVFCFSMYAAPLTSSGDWCTCCCLLIIF